MAIPTIDATVGGINSNSFGLRSEADLFHASQLHPDAIWPLNISATSSIGSGTNGLITITIDAEGTEGNSYTIEVKLASAIDTALSANLTGTTIVVTLGTDHVGVADPTKNTATLVTAILNTLTGISASVSGTGATVIPVTAVQTFSGGSYIEELKNPALIMAQLWMTSLIQWTGYRTSPLQNLPWPRIGMESRSEWVYIEHNVVPNEVKYAQFELARLMINADRTIEQPQVIEGLARLDVGSLRLLFRDPSGRGAPALTPLVIPDSVADLLVPSWIYCIEDRPASSFELERA